MLHIAYILVFTIVAFLAIGNLIRSLITLSSETQGRYSARDNRTRKSTAPRQYGYNTQIHPELLDKSGNPIKEPLLVMRSVSVEDARQQLNSLYNSSPSPVKEKEEEA